MSARTDPGRAAGSFSRWLSTFLAALRGGRGIRVDCRECVGCCSARHFVLVEPSERERIERIRPGVLVPFPGRSDGSALIPYGKGGRCAFLGPQGCGIYARRPLACRQFDCRALAAAGLRADLPGQRGIARAAARWKFSPRGPLEERRLLAVRAAASFVRQHADLFPGGRIPGRPEQLAVVAAKIHRVFLGRSPSSTRATARAAVDELRAFQEPG